MKTGSRGITNLTNQTRQNQGAMESNTSKAFIYHRQSNNVIAMKAKGFTRQYPVNFYLSHFILWLVMFLSGWTTVQAQSAGVQTITGGATYRTGSSIDWRLFDNTVGTRGTDYDGIDITLNLTFESDVTLNLVFDETGSSVDWTDAFWASSKTGANGWKIFEVDGTVTDLSNVTLTAASAATDANSATLTTVLAGNVIEFALEELTEGGKQVIYLTYSIQSSDATLTSLVVNDGSDDLTLSPVFDPATLSYTAVVEADISGVTLTPTAAAGATVTVAGTAVNSGSPSGLQGLSVGINSIAVVVTAEDGDITETYTVVVIREPNTPAAPTLDAVTGSGFDVGIDPNGNDLTSTTILYSIKVEEGGNTYYVQADGTLAAAPVYQTLADWHQDAGNTRITLSGLTVGETYTVSIDAIIDNTNPTVGSGFGPTASIVTCSNPTVAGIIAGDQTICFNTAPVAFTSTSGASDFGGTLEYKWQFNSNDPSVISDWMDIPSTDGETYQSAPLTQTTWFRRLARVDCKSDWTGAAESNVIQVTVDPATVAGSISGTTTIEIRTGDISLSLSGQVGDILRWQRSADNSSWTDISNTTTSLTETPLGVGTWYYRAEVQSGVCGAAFTAAHTVTVTASSNGDLASLTVGTGTLTPVFDPATLTYTVSVPDNTSSFSFTPTVDDSGASLTVNGNAHTSGTAFTDNALNSLSKTYSLEVTAEDGSTETYTLIVFKTQSSIPEPTGTWLPLFVGDNFDPNDDQQSTADTDIVGNAANPLMQGQQLDVDINGTLQKVYYFRVRLANAIRNNNMPPKTSFYYGFDVNNDQKINFFVEANLNAPTPFVSYHVSDPKRDGSGPSQTAWLNSSNNINIERPLDNLNGMITYYTVIIEDGSTTNVDLDAPISGANTGNDTWLEFAITQQSFSSFTTDVLGTAYNGSDVIGLVAFTSTSQTANGDIAGIDDRTADLSKSWDELGIILTTSLNSATSDEKDPLTVQVISTETVNGDATVTGIWNGNDYPGSGLLVEVFETDGTTLRESFTYDSANPSTATTGISINGFSWEVDVTGYDPGVYPVKATLSDSSADPTSVSSIGTLTVNRILVNDLVTADQTPTLTGEADQFYQGVNVNLEIRDSNGDPLNPAQTYSVPIAQDATWSFDVLVTLPFGTYETYVSLTLTDQNNNTSTSFDTGVLTVVDAPLISIDPASLTATYGAVTLSGQSNEPTTQVTIEVEDSNGVVTPYTTQTDSNGDWDYDFSAILNAGTYQVTASLSDGTVTVSDQQNLIINKAGLTVTADNDTKVYDGLGYSGGNGVTYSGFVNNETESDLGGTLTYSGTSQGAINVGASYVITPGGLTSDNYDITFADGTLSITKAGLTVTADNDTKVYDGLGYSGGNGVTYSGFVNNETESDLGGTLTYSGTSQGAINVGASYVITPGGLTSDNYDITFADGTLSITKAGLTVTADNDTKVYDGTALTNAGSSITDGSLVTGHTYTAAVTGTQTNVGSSDNVASAAVILEGSNNDVTANYDISYVKGTLTVTPLAIEITADSETKVYDGTALTNAGSSITDGSLVTGHTYTATVTGTQTNVGSSDNVASAAVILEGSNNDVTANYVITYANGTLEVTARPLEITANDGSKIYGDTYTFANTEYTLTNSTSLAANQALTLDLSSTGAAASAAVGSYDIDLANVKVEDGGTDVTSNYSITLEKGTLTVGKQAIEITADSETKVYDGTALTNAGSSITDGSLVTGHTYTATVTGTQTNVGSSDNVASAAVILEGSNNDVTANYAITYANGTLEVTARPLEITANDDSKIYGDTYTFANTEYTLTSSTSLAPNQTLTLDLSSTGAAALAAVGSYDIDLANVKVEEGGTDVTSNYSITTNKGILMVLGKNLSDASITVEAIADLTYNGQAKTPTPVVKDGTTTLSEGTDYTLSYADNTNVGTATVTITGVGNYSGTRSQNFVIAPKTLTVTPDSNQSKEYGESDPVLTYTFDGEVAGETPAFNNSLRRVQGENVGNYEITKGSLSLKDNGVFKAANYQLNLTTGVDFTITQATLTVTANNDSKFVTQADAIGYAGVSYSGFKFGESESVLNTTNLTIIRTNAGTEAAGVYADVLEASGVTAQNYGITYEKGDFTIVGADQLLVKLSDTEVVYGQNPVYQVASAGYLLSGNMQVVDLTSNASIIGNQVTISDGASGTAVFDIVVKSPNFSSSGELVVDSYVLDADNIVETSPNFNNTLVLQSVLKVTPKKLTASISSSKTKVYDGNAQLLDLELSLASPVNLDQVMASATGDYDSKDAGARSYTVTGLTLNGADAGNYFIQGGATATITGTDGEITQRTLTVTPDAGQQKVFGESDPTLTYSHSGSVRGETPGFSGALSRVSGEAQGTYVIEQGSLAIIDNNDFLEDNYTLDFTTGVLFTIGKKAINAADITVDAIADLTYNGLAQTPAPVVKDGNLTLTAGTDYSLAYSEHTDVGKATITITGLGNYTEERKVFFTIVQKTLTVTPDANQSKEYGESDPTLTYTYSGEVSGETPDFENTLSRVQGENVGNYEILQGSLSLKDNGAFKAANYQLNLTTGVDFEITQATLTVTANNDSKFVTQADAIGYAGVSYSGFKFGESESVLNTTNLTIIRTNAGTEAAGVYADVLEASGVTAQNYGITYEKGDFTIVGADQLLVKLLDTEVVYGATPVYQVASAQYFSSTGNVIQDLTQSTQINGTEVTVTDGSSGTAVFDLGVKNPELSSSNNLKVGVCELEGTIVTQTSSNFSNTIVLQGMLEVTPMELTAAVSSSKIKVYDGNAKMLNLSLDLSNPITADVVEASGSGDYDSKDAGARSYTVTGLTLNGADAGNYFIQGGATATITGTDGEITQRTLTVTPDAGQQKVFGESDPTLTYSHSGSVRGETPGFSGALSRVSGEAQGTYVIEQGSLAIIDNNDFLEDNYTLDFTTGVLFTIGKKAINAADITVDAIADLTYNGLAQTPAPVVKDGNLTLTAGTDYSLAYSEHTDVGKATITITGLGNYTEERKVFFTIVQKTLTVTPDANQSKEYGESDPVLTYTFDGEVTGETPAFNNSLSRVQGENVSNYEILQGSLSLKDNGAFKAANYQLNLTTGVDFEITQATLTVTANNDSKFVTQADAIGYAGVSYRGFKFGESESVLNTTNLTIIRTNAGTEAAGVYADVLEASGVTAQNYGITYEKGDFTIVGADQLLVKLSDTEVVYGATPVYQVASAQYFSSTGNVIQDLTQSTQINGTEVTVTDGSSGTAVFDLGVKNPELSSSNNLKVGVCELEGTIVTQTSSNFSNTIVLQGMLEVTPMELTAAVSSSKIKVYDGNAKMLNLSLDLSNPITADVVEASGSGDYESKDAGVRSYTVTGLTLSGPDAGNYYIQGGAMATITGTDGEITQRTLTVTPDGGQRKTFGESDPTLTYSHSGSVRGETPGFSGALSRVSGEAEGTYAIESGTLTLADNGSFMGGNYTQEFTSGVLFTIGQKNLQSADINMEAIGDLVYTGTAQEPEPIVKDGTTTLSEGTDYTLSYANNTDVGTATVTITGLGNYSGTTSQTFTIKKAALTITAEDKSKTFGEADPELTVTYTGLVNGEQATVLNGTLSITRAAGEAVGDYMITASGLTSDNYEITYEMGTLTIGMKVVSGVDFEVATIPSAVYTGLAQRPEPEVKDGTTTLTKDVDYTLSYADNTNAGTATVTITGIGNYSGTTSQTFTIKKAGLTITAEDKSKTFGEADPVFTVSYTGLLNGEQATVLNGTLSITRAAGEAVGDYTITASGLTSDNYEITYETGTLTITEKSLADGDLTVEAIGDLVYTGTAQEPEPIVKDGTTTLSEGTDYTLSYANNTDVGTATVTITGIGSYNGVRTVEFEILKRSLTVRADSGQGKERLAADPVLTYTLSEELIAGNEITGSLTREPGEDPGSYAILLGTLDAGSNYEIVFVSTAFTIVDTTNPQVSFEGGDISDDPVTGQHVTSVTLEEGEQEVGTFSGDKPVIWTLEATGERDDTGFFELISNGNGNVTVRFKDKLDPGIYVVNLCATDASGNKSCVKITVLVKGQIALVIPTDWIEIAWGSSTSIPREQEVMTTEGNAFKLLVAVDESILNRFRRGDYLLSGTFTLPVYFENSKDLKADIRVRVLPKPAPQDILLSNNTFEGTKNNQEIAIGTLTVVDTIDNRHVLGLPHGLEDNRYFRVINDVLYWSSEDPAAGKTTFKVVVRVTDRDGNTLDKMLEINRVRKRIEDIVIYNTFTPQGDGINDNWGVPEIRYYKGARIQVFERSGKRVFYTENPDIRWDGSFNGVELPIGTYYWTIEVRETGEVRKGMLNLLRK